MLVRSALSSGSPETRPFRTPTHESRFDPVELMGPAIPFGRDEEVFGEGEPTEYIYKVISGAVRTYKMLSDGRRQICAFHLPGDVFGLDAAETHSFSAEALCQSIILVVKRSSVTAMSERQAAVARALWLLTASELQKMQDHVMLLVKTAPERVASFLLQMAERTPGEEEIELPMSRQDIADYLGLALETVSRTLSQFESRATIGMPSARRVVLRNRKALDHLDA